PPMKSQIFGSCDGNLRGFHTSRQTAQTNFTAKLAENLRASPDWPENLPVSLIDRSPERH
ncbi:MAG: hypothetical protein ACK6D6_15640, partial [Planctomyces sp.]